MFTTADLWDVHGEHLQCVDPIFKSYGTKLTFSGKIVTLKLFEDNSYVRKQLATDGSGKVLVVDGGGSLRCALLGDQLAAMALKNNWNGIIIHGCIRDSAVINTMPIGIRALNTSPVKSEKLDKGEIHIPVTFGGKSFITGHYMYVDPDGILISPDNILM